MKRATVGVGGAGADPAGELGPGVLDGTGVTRYQSWLTVGILSGHSP